MSSFFEKVRRRSSTSVVSPISPTRGEPSAMPSNVVNNFVTNFIDYDEEIFKLWINGLSVEEAANDQLRKDEVQEFGANFPSHVSLRRIVIRDVDDHFRNFTTLEKLLVQPASFITDSILQMNPENKKSMVQLYYELDDVVVREILGKKLNARNRKDLDEVAEKTGKYLRSCRRQFDNMKRIVKHLEETSGPLMGTLMNDFIINKETAQRYAAIAFLLTNKFEINKKKLNYVTFEDFYNCAFIMIDNWLFSPSGATIAPKYATDEYNFDKDFLLQFKELKRLTEREKEHKSLCLCELRKSGGCPVPEAEVNFKLFSRPILSIATVLYTPKEMRDFFVDVVEKVLEPARNAKWEKEQLKAFLSAYQTGGTLLLDSKDNLCKVWRSYMKVVIVCAVQLHHS